MGVTGPSRPLSCRLLEGTLRRSRFRLYSFMINPPFDKAIDGLISHDLWDGYAQPGPARMHSQMRGQQVRRPVLACITEDRSTSGWRTVRLHRDSSRRILSNEGDADSPIQRITTIWPAARRPAPRTSGAIRSYSCLCAAPAIVPALPT
jgi:hypothetical protein